MLATPLLCGVGLAEIYPLVPLSSTFDGISPRGGSESELGRGTLARAIRPNKDFTPPASQQYHDNDNPVILVS